MKLSIWSVMFITSYLAYSHGFQHMTIYVSIFSILVPVCPELQWRAVNYPCDPISGADVSWWPLNGMLITNKPLWNPHTSHLAPGIWHLYKTQLTLMPSWMSCGMEHSMKSSSMLCYKHIKKQLWRIFDWGLCFTKTHHFTRHETCDENFCNRGISRM